MKGKVYIFSKTGNEYVVLEEGELKDPSTRKWIPCVVYRSIETGNCYTREKTDFLNKFKEKL